ncbi:MAG TPA: alpha/beta hydrolase-fold protein, partial [Vicinamibacteria bacterium]|nr:alpha/beta hydrolase-fold protein [Vicinamibacteria bacterium]
MKTAALVLLLAAAPAAAEVRYATFSSPSLGKDVAYAVQLPPSYATAATRRYPVVYALHGLFENPGFWERRGLAPMLETLWQKGDVPEMVVVAVDGDNSFFVDGPAGRWEQMMSRDFVAHVESTYRVIPGRPGRGVLGISMGGYAALRMALAHPDLFRAVATHSAMLLEKIPTTEEGAGRWHMAAFYKVFGTPIDAALWSANDPLALAAKADPKATPALYLDCGTEDRYGLFAGNRELHR